MLSLMEPFDDFHLDTDVYFFGVNMAIRRDVLFQVGGFNPELMGNFTIGDGESGLLRKLKERNYLIGYVPDALVYHCIPRQRMTLDYLRRWQAHLAGALLYPRYHKLMPGPFGLLADVLAMLPSCLSTLARDVFSRFTTEGDSISLQLKSALSRAKVRYVVYLLLKPELRRIVTRENWLNPKSEGLEVI